MDYSKTPYFHVAHARDLTGRDRIIFRLLEILPGFLSWGTLILIVVGSVFFPMPVAVFIIVFDLYWLLKTVHLSFHQYYNWRRLKHNINVDWQAKLADLKYEHLRHVILLPFYKEGKDVIEASLKSLLASHYDPKKMIIVLAAEVRAGSEYTGVTVELQNMYAKYFDDFIVPS